MLELMVVVVVVVVVERMRGRGRVDLEKERSNSWNEINFSSRVFRVVRHTQPLEDTEA